MRQPDAAERVRQRIQDWIKLHGRGSLLRLSKAVPGQFGKERDHQSWATGISKGRQDLRLADLDAVAELLDCPPGELVRGYDRNCLELTMDESRLIKYFRALPRTVQRDWLRFLDFVFMATTKPEEKPARKRRQRRKRNNHTPPEPSESGNDAGVH